jgi:H/ACA ribonucleoprotein complex subunit 4
MPRTVAPWEIKHELLVKADGQTDQNFGREPKARSADELLNHGVINLDKQAGPSSHEVAAWVKRILKQDKVGHGGTLEATA